AGDLGGEGAELVHHRVDGVLELEDLAAHVDGDLLGEVAGGHGGGDLGDVADLVGEGRGHRVDGVGVGLPRACHSRHLRLAVQSLAARRPAGLAGDLGGEGAEPVHHRVDGVLELEDLALDVDGDLAGEVAGGDGLGHVRDVAHLGGEVPRHRVDGV